MEEQPSIEPAHPDDTGSRQRRMMDFMKRLAPLLVVSVAGAGLYAFVSGSRNLRGFSDALFVIGAALLIIGLLPMVVDIFSRSTVTFRRGERTFQDVLDEERDRSQRDDKITYLFGIGGVIIIALSFLIGFSV
jgi:hypothetical protein